MPSAPAGAGFAAGEDVFAHHGPLIYNAKVISCRKKGAAIEYKIHYQGWKKSNDEWVTTERILKKTTENESFMAEHNKKNMQEQNRMKEEKKRALKAAKHEERQQKRSKQGSLDELRNSLGSDKDIEVPIPFVLKKRLLDEWEAITQAPKKIMQLPARLNVRDVLAQFLASEEKELGEALLVSHLVVEGLTHYFDRCLGSVLLYPSERTQYEQLVLKGESAKSYSQLVGASGETKEEEEALAPSALYGAGHLLRVFVRLPILMEQERGSNGVGVKKKELAHMKFMCNRILRFLAKKDNQHLFDCEHIKAA